MKCNLLTSARTLQVTGEPAWVATVVVPTNPLFSQSYSGYRNGSVCCFSKIFMPLGRSGLGEASRWCPPRIISRMPSSLGDQHLLSQALAHNTRSVRYFGRSVEYESLSGKLANAVDRNRFESIGYCR